MYENTDKKVENLEEGDLLIEITNNFLLIFIFIQSNNFFYLSHVTMCPGSSGPFYLVTYLYYVVRKPENFHFDLK